jgi:hypothetical protein
MNARVWLLLRDYLRRTNGAWLLIIFIQIIQTVTFWAAGIQHAPLLATVLASFTYASMSESPRSALRTLPLTPSETALFRWWGSFGLPAFIVLGCAVAAGMMSTTKGWPVPSGSFLASSAIAVVGALGWLSIIAVQVRLTRLWSAAVWGAAAVAGLIGLPVSALSPPLLLLLALAAIGLSIKSSTAAESLRLRSENTESVAPFLAGWLHGWSVLFVVVGRSTVALCAAALAATAILHVAISPRALPGVQGAVIWLFVSAVAAATCLPMRRWVEAVHSMRLLPLDSRWLAFIVHLTVMTPGVVTCLVVIGAQQLSPRLGLDIPWYMLIVFLLAPITLVRWHRPQESNPIIRQWAPAMQQAAWPLWAGSFCALRGVPFMPFWFLLYLSIVTALFSVAGYRVLLAGIRSPAGLESQSRVLLEQA